MQVERSEQIRNIALTGHNDTGKTTLASALLFTGGVFNRLNRVMFNWIHARAKPNSRGLDESPSIIQLRLQLGF